MTGPLTPATARQIFSVFLLRFEAMGSDPALIPALTTGAQEQGEEFFGGKWGPALGTLTSEAFYVTRQTGYPRWFLATGDSSGTAASFVLVQPSASAPWRCAAETLDYDGASLVQKALSYVNVDAQGYASAIAPGDQALEVSPAALAGAYTGYLDHLGRGGPPFVSGPNTTGYVANDKKLFAGAPRYGWRITDLQQTTPLPFYSLSIGPGALVVFTTKETLTWQALSSSTVLHASASSAASFYVPPSLVTKGITAAQVHPGLRLTVVAMNRLLALVPPTGQGQIDILAYTGQAVSVSHSGP
jgi:hypothetical protein